MDEEKYTQDMFGVSTPTFVTPDAKANAQLQIESLKNAQIFYFLNLQRPHVLDLIMQALCIKTQSSPFEAPYFSCVPYLLGEGQAMQYSVWPKSNKRTPIPRLPLRPPDDYLRNAMVASLAEGDVELDIRVQLQTDPHLMPIENAGVLWPEKLSPRVSVATLRIPRQKFDSPAQMEFAQAAVVQPVALASPSIARSATRAGRGSGCTGSCRQLRHDDERRAALRADRGRGVRVAGMRHCILLTAGGVHAPESTCSCGQYVRM